MPPQTTRPSAGRELGRAYAATAGGAGVGALCPVLGAVIGLVVTGHPLGLVVGGGLGAVLGLFVGVVVAVVGMGRSRTRTGLAMAVGCGVVAAVSVGFDHHGWLRLVLAATLPAYAVAAGRLLRRSARSVASFAATTAALAALLLVDVWIAESAEVHRIEHRIQVAGVDVWAPPDASGCRYAFTASGDSVGYVRTRCADPVRDTFVLQRAAPGSSLGPEPGVVVDASTAPGTLGGWQPPAAVTSAASMRRGDTVVTVRRTSVRDPFGEGVLAVARGLGRRDPAWLATRGTALHRWVHDHL